MMNFSDYKDYTNKAINSVIEEEVQQFIETLYEAYKEVQQFML